MQRYVFFFFLSTFLEKNFKAEARSVSIRKEFHNSFNNGNQDNNDMLPEVLDEFFITTDEERL